MKNKTFKSLTTIALALSMIQTPLAAYAQVTATDSRGEEVTVESTPERVITLGYPEFDTLRALGLEDLVVAAPVYSTPAYIGAYSDSVIDTANLHEPNLEVLASAQADLIVATGRSSSLIPEFEQIAPVFEFAVDNANYWESFVNINTEFAKLFGKEDEASAIIEEIDTQAQVVRDLNEGLEEQTLVLMLNEGEMAVYGAESRFGLIYQVLGFSPMEGFEIEDQRHGQSISYEGIMNLNPDRIFVIDRTQAIGSDNSMNENLLDNALIKETDAFKNDQIHFLDSQLWYVSGTGLESTQLQISEITEIMQ